MAEINYTEKFFVDLQPWLLSCGYQLRPRYRPGWVPSWVTHPAKDTLDFITREDYFSYLLNPVMDAVRLSDNKQVMMKKIYSKESGRGEEQAISEFVSSPTQLRDPTNHCVPLLETLQIPGEHEYVIIVMPFLRQFDSPRFDTIGEALDMMRQGFEGIQYLHRHRIAHRDCTYRNLMMDGSEMYPDGFHPIKHDYNREMTGSAFRKYTRTQRPPKYYWIDFGLSVSFDPSDKNPRAVPSNGGDKSAPENRDVYRRIPPPEPTNPFATDIYYLGNILRLRFTEGSTQLRYEPKAGFEFLTPLVTEMIQEDPEKRPTIDQCVAQLEEIIQSLSWKTFRSQVWHGSDNILGFISRFPGHWARRIVYTVSQTPAIPHHDA